MEAGRELDALIAEKVMGWKSQYGVHLFPPIDEPNRKRFERWNGETMVTEIPHYSTDIAAAWPIAEKFKMSVIRYNGSWLAGDLDISFSGMPSEIGSFGAEADTAPLAIVLAALKAVGVEI